MTQGPTPARGPARERRAQSGQKWEAVDAQGLHMLCEGAALMGLGSGWWGRRVKDGRRHITLAGRDLSVLTLGHMGFFLRA